MANPYHDGDGRFCSKGEMSKAITDLKQQAQTAFQEGRIDDQVEFQAKADALEADMFKISLDRGEGSPYSELSKSEMNRVAKDTEDAEAINYFIANGTTRTIHNLLRDNPHLTDEQYADAIDKATNPKLRTEGLKNGRARLDSYTDEEIEQAYRDNTLQATDNRIGDRELRHMSSIVARLVAINNYNNKLTDEDRRGSIYAGIGDPIPAYEHGAMNTDDLRRYARTPNLRPDAIMRAPDRASYDALMDGASNTLTNPENVRNRIVREAVSNIAGYKPTDEQYENLIRIGTKFEPLVEHKAPEWVLDQAERKQPSLGSTRRLFSVGCWNSINGGNVRAITDSYTQTKDKARYVYHTYKLNPEKMAAGNLTEQDLRYAYPDDYSHTTTYDADTHTLTVKQDTLS